MPIWLAQLGLLKATTSAGEHSGEKTKSECKLDLHIHCAIFNRDLIVAKLPQFLWEPD